VRSICIISREYPPDSAFGGIARVAEMEARALAEAGLDVHVISLAPSGLATTHVQDGVIVHRLPDVAVALPADMPYVHVGAWSQAVAKKYVQLDALARFDVVQAQDYYAETLHLARRPETPLVIELHAPSAVVAEHSGRVRTAGHRAFEALEAVAMRAADMLIAPSALVLEEARGLLGAETPPAELIPFPFDAARFAGGERIPRGGRVRLVFVGRLEPLKGADLALAGLADARRRGVDAHLTLVGRDVHEGGVSHRREVLIPLMRELGLDFGHVRFVEQLPEEGVRRHLRAADCALLPSRFENFHTAAVEALAVGVPVLTADRGGLASWLSAEDGLYALPLERYPEEAGAALLDLDALAAAGARGAQRVRELFDTAAVTERRMRLYERLLPERAQAPGSDGGGPSLAVVVLAHNQLQYTKRCLRSVLEFTDTPFTLYLVDNASTDGTAEWAAALDPRVRVVRSERNLGVSGGRNAGLAAIEGEPDFVVFLDNDVQLFADWWRPFVAALDENPEAGIAGELGIRLEPHPGGRLERPLSGPGPLPADMVTGFCMVMRSETVRHVGRFDEALGLFWHDDDDYCLRARRLGYEILHVGSSRLLHFEHRSSSEVDGIWAGAERAAELSHQNQRYLAAKEAQPALDGARGFAVLGFAGELVERPELLAAFGRCFSADDDATLVIYAPDECEESLARRLGTAIAQAGLDAEDGPDLLGLAMPRDEAIETTIAHGVHAVLTERAPEGAFHAPPHFAAGDGAELRELAERVWASAGTEGLVGSTVSPRC
jgi:glycosyltransferase involved in cell wall biosynthesis